MKSHELVLANMFAFLSFLMVGIPVFVRWLKYRNGLWEMRTDNASLTFHLISRLPSEKMLLDLMILRCESDEKVVEFFRKYPSKDDDDLRTKYCLFFIKACLESGGEIEGAVISKEFARAWAPLLQTLPPKYFSYYQTKISIYSLNPFQGPLSLPDIPPVTRDHPEYKEHQAELISWKKVYFPHPKTPAFQEEMNLLGFAVSNRQVTFRFGKRSAYMREDGSHSFRPEAAK